MSKTSNNEVTIAVFDLDRTLTKHGTFTPFLLSAMPKDPSLLWALFPTILTAVRYLTGAISRKVFKERMLELFVAGRSREEINLYIDAFVEKVLLHNLRRSTRSAIEKHRTQGHILVLATASMDLWARPLARRLGFASVVCTRSSWDDNDHLLGKIEGENCYGQAKLSAVAKALPAPRKDCMVIAYSDHRSDVPLLSWADRGIAVNPRRGFKRQARELGLEVVDWNVPPEKDKLAYSNCEEKHLQKLFVQ